MKRKKWTISDVSEQTVQSLRTMAVQTGQRTGVVLDQVVSAFVAQRQKNLRNRSDKSEWSDNGKLVQ